MMGYWRAPELTAEKLAEGPDPGERTMSHARPLHDRRGRRPLLRRPQRRHHQDARREGELGRGRERAPRRRGDPAGGGGRSPGRAPRRGGTGLRPARRRSSADRAGRDPGVPDAARELHGPAGRRLRDRAPAHRLRQDPQEEPFPGAAPRSRRRGWELGERRKDPRHGEAGLPGPGPERGVGRRDGRRPSPAPPEEGPKMRRNVTVLAGSS